MLHSVVYNTSEVCFQLGVRHAVLSPGSRNAPLTISFARNDKIQKWIIPDERAAAFVALGIAQQEKEPVVLCCTSGTALLNYAPAITEAFYREIPLIVLSADRPLRLIDQRDGQTIRQYEALKNHVKTSVQLPVYTDVDFGKNYNELLIKTMERAKDLPIGPVHINIPFEEPFYPALDQQLSFNPVGHEPSSKVLKKEVKWPEINDFTRVLILVGQQDDPSLSESLKELSKRVPVLRTPLNNLEAGIEHVDLFIKDKEELKPELLITCGLSVSSKNLKAFLRKHCPEKHIHFDPAGVPVDTFQSNPEQVKGTLTDFVSSSPFGEVDENYLHKWASFEKQVKHAFEFFFQNAPYSETSVAWHVLRSIPVGSILHLSNSMPVRFAEMFGVKPNVRSWCNRGTSGIDGCTSTAVGTALVTDQPNVFITGDLSFLYDRNAFFHNYKINSLKIVVLNNAGGGIFRLIDGPARLPELENYFEARHNKTAKYICAENDIQYLTATNLQEVNEALGIFHKTSGHPVLLEIFTDPVNNQNAFKELKRYINEHIDV